MQQALVTGAAGFIGSHLVDSLLDQNYRVRGLDSLRTGSKANLDTALQSDTFEFIEGDIRDRDIVDECVTEVDVVFHLAASISVQDSINAPTQTTAVNCAGTATVLEAARDAGVDDVVLASSAAVYGSADSVPVSEDEPLSPESPYALSKRYGEQLAAQIDQRNDVNCVSLRFFNVFGPRQDPAGDYAAVIPAFIQRVRNGEPPVIYGDGEQTRDFVHVDDVVQGLIRAAEHSPPCPVINIGAGRRITINRLASLVIDLVGSACTPEYGPARDGEVRHSEADISRATDLLGYTPKVELRDGLEETIAYFRSER